MDNYLDKPCFTTKASRTKTFQFRIYPSQEDISKLEKSMENVSKFFMTCFNKFFFYEEDKTKSDKENNAMKLKMRNEFCKKDFAKSFNLGTKQAGVLATFALKQSKLHKAAIQYHIEQNEYKLKWLNSEIEKLSLKLKEQSLTPEEIKKIKTNLWHKNRNVQHTQSTIKQLSNQSITFGKKENQTKLSQNLISQQEWKN